MCCFCFAPTKTKVQALLDSLGVASRSRIRYFIYASRKKPAFPPAYGYPVYRYLHMSFPEDQLPCNSQFATSGRTSLSNSVVIALLLTWLKDLISPRRLPCIMICDWLRNQHRMSKLLISTVLIWNSSHCHVCLQILLRQQIRTCFNSMTGPSTEPKRL
jgi:hypothetical protein